MAQISDVLHASAVFYAARQELAWAYSGEFTDVPEPMKGAVHTISEVLNEAEMRWVASSREEEHMAAVVDKENRMAVVATGGGEKTKKRKNIGMVKELSIGEAEKKTKDWLLRLEEVACDMRAVARKELLGDYSRIDDDKLSARWFSACFPRASRAARIAPTIDTVTLELEKLKQQYYEEFGHSTGLPLADTCTEQPARSSAAGSPEERETSGNADELVPVERGDDVKPRIIDMVHDETRKTLRSGILSILLQIVGPPCVGKTALVKSVFLESSFKAGYKVWVDMRKGWDIKEIHESIIEVIGQHHFDGLDDGGREISKVKSEADYGRYIKKMMLRNETWLLLVLDNMAEEQDTSMLEKLLEFLHDNARTVIAVVTTQSQALAKYISFKWRRRSEHFYRDAVCRLHPLSDDKCWEIIKRTSGLDLEATAAGTAVREIASKCSGIPLAAKVLGRFLQSVDPQELPGQIRDIWNIGGGFSSDSQQLRRLPIHSAAVFTQLKRSSSVLVESWLSLAYCAFVFPKDKGHGVAMCDLLNQWCSLGITSRECGASYILELLKRSLILGEGKDWASLANDDEETEAATTLLTMQDLMHDFARYLLGDRLVVVDGKNNGATPSTLSHVNNKSSSAYMALVTNFDAKELDISSILPTGILAIRFEGCGEMELSDGAFASFKYLRLLDLSGYTVKKKLPDFIRHMKQLRYLKAPGIQDQECPRSITGLQELMYLILHGSCQLEDLTKAFDRLSNLLHVDLSGCTRLKGLPDSFGRLWRLEHLDLSACSGIEALPESFGWLRNMRHLVMSGCSGLQDLPESFGMLASLRHLDLSHCSGLKALPDSFWSLRLKRLDLSACSGFEALPEWFGWLPNLSHLHLSGCSGLKALPESFGGLSRLRHLDLSRCSGLQDLPKSFGDLRELRHLDLSGLSSLQARPMSVLPMELRHLNLSGCSLLQEEQLPGAPEPNQLRHLDLSGCSSVSILLL